MKTHDEKWMEWMDAIEKTQHYPAWEVLKSGDSYVILAGHRAVCTNISGEDAFFIVNARTYIYHNLGGRK